MSAVSRRGALSAIAVAGVMAISACTENDPLAEQAGKPEKDYVSGAGVVAKAAESDRDEPLDLDVTALDGHGISLASWRGAPVVLNLWYAACPPCRSEAPVLRSVAEDLGDDVHFLGVNVRDQRTEAQAFVDSFRIPYSNTLDDDGEVTALFADILPPRATPATIVLDEQSRIAARVVGEIDEETLRELIAYA